MLLVVFYWIGAVVAAAGLVWWRHVLLQMIDTLLFNAAYAFMFAITIVLTNFFSHGQLN